MVFSFFKKKEVISENKNVKFVVPSVADRYPTRLMHYWVCKDCLKEFGIVIPDVNDTHVINFVCDKCNAILHQKTDNGWIEWKNNWDEENKGITSKEKLRDKLLDDLEKRLPKCICGGNYLALNKYIGNDPKKDKCMYCRSENIEYTDGASFNIYIQKLGFALLDFNCNK